MDPRRGFFVTPYERTGALTLTPCRYFKGRVPAEPCLETYLKRPKAKSEEFSLFTSGCHAVNVFTQKVCPRRSPGPLRMLHAELWVVAQGDVERSEGS
jgi:hypothetical protein